MAWIKVDTETLLSYHTHVVGDTHRLKVTNSNNDRTWSLHIKSVEVQDRGFYMCQINTEPMISQEGYLDVTGLLQCFYEVLLKFYCINTC